MFDIVELYIFPNLYRCTNFSLKENIIKYLRYQFILGGTHKCAPIYIVLVCISGKIISAREVWMHSQGSNFQRLDQLPLFINFYFFLWEGPYVVTKVLNPVAHQLKGNDDNLITNA